MMRAGSTQLLLLAEASSSGMLLVCLFLMRCLRSEVKAWQVWGLLVWLAASELLTDLPLLCFMVGSMYLCPQLLACSQVWSLVWK